MRSVLQAHKVYRAFKETLVLQAHRVSRELREFRVPRGTSDQLVHKARPEAQAAPVLKDRKVLQEVLDHRATSETPGHKESRVLLAALVRLVLLAPPDPRVTRVSREKSAPQVRKACRV